MARAAKDAAAQAPIDRVKQYIADRESYTRRAGSVANAREGFAYYWFVPEEQRGNRGAALRARLTAMGYEVAEGGEYVPTVEAAEIWCAPNEVAKALFEARKARDKQRREELSGKLAMKRRTADRSADEIMDELESADPSVMERLRSLLFPGS